METYWCPHCTMCTLQPNKLRPIYEFEFWYPIKHIFVQACSSVRKIHFFTFLWFSNSRSVITIIVALYAIQRILSWVDEGVFFRLQACVQEYLHREHAKGFSYFAFSYPCFKYFSYKYFLFSCLHTSSFTCCSLQDVFQSHVSWG